MDGNVHCSFVIGKARVTPLNKQLTIPRLELTAAVVSARVSDYIKSELRFEDMKEYFWVDSKVVLGYINNESKRFHTYVANRVQQIRELTVPDQWRYVSTDVNPSDDASRGITARKLVEDSRWLTGPHFLWDSDFQPTAVSRFECNDETAVEVSKEMKGVIHNVLKTSSRVVSSNDRLIDRFDRFSSWNKARHAAANCLRFKAKLLRAVKTSNRKAGLIDVMTEPDKQMTMQDLKEVEKAFIKETQERVFKEEILILEGGPKGGKKTIDQSPAAAEIKHHMQA
ncbi:uncharacterized protein [Ptychodera flava]|uniref:uncharacterized protein n=1 Tax=Ptychodera flava TaxID=63121 RepID=UPI00396A4D02